MRIAPTVAMATSSTSVNTCSFERKARMMVRTANQKNAKTGKRMRYLKT